MKHENALRTEIDSKSSPTRGRYDLQTRRLSNVFSHDDKTSDSLASGATNKTEKSKKSGLTSMLKEGVTLERTKTLIDYQIDEWKANVRDFAIGIPTVREILKAPGHFWTLVWLAAGLACLGFCLGSSIDLLFQLIEQPTGTKITYVTNGTLQFPYVSICTYSRINQSAVDVYNVSEDMIPYLLSVYKGMYWFYNEGFNQKPDLLGLRKDYKRFTQRYTEMTQKNFSVYEFIEENSLRCKQVLSFCLMQGGEFDCCENAIEYFSEVGKCFALNPSIDQQSLPGEMGGLKVYVSNWRSAYPETVINSHPDEGVQVHVTHPSAGTRISTNPVLVYPNTHAMVRVRKIRRSLLDKANLNTNSSSCTRTKTLRFYEQYTATACFSECIARLIAESCDCYTIGQVPIKDLNKSRICSPFMATNCLLPLLMEQTSSFLWDLYNLRVECGLNCPIACDSWTYETSVSYSAVPNRGYAIARKRQLEREPDSNLANMNIDEKSFIIVDVFYDNLVYTRMDEQLLFQFNTFVSKFGGQLSIWLGIRFLTIVQAAYYTLVISVLMVPWAWAEILRKCGWIKLDDVRAATPLDFDMAHESDNEHDSDGTHEPQDDNTTHDFIARATQQGIEKGSLPRSVERQRASVLRSAQEDAEGDLHRRNSRKSDKGSLGQYVLSDDEM